VALTVARQQAIEEIRSRLSSDERFAGRWRGKGRWAEIHVPHAERRLWSPHLSLRLDEDEDSGCSIFGRFAPHPEVWTCFMFLYVGFAFAAVFGAVFGYVQWASGEAAWGVWLALAGLVVIGLIHGAGALGQRLGQGQMLVLRQELDQLLTGLAEDAHTPPRNSGEPGISDAATRVDVGGT
jgi:hypothetical protein